MFLAHEWAKGHAIPASFIDVAVAHPFKEGMSTECKEHKDLIAYLEEKIGHSDWKLLNVTAENAKLYHPLRWTVFEREKHKNRERQMAKNIEHAMPDKGNVVLLAGTDYLDFLGYSSRKPDCRYDMASPERGSNLA